MSPNPHQAPREMISETIARVLSDSEKFSTLSLFNMELAERLYLRLAQSAQLVETRRVLIAIIGNFSSGKSTLINSLIGLDLLPTGNVPVTAQAYHVGAHANYGCGYHLPRIAHPHLKKMKPHKLIRRVHALHQNSKNMGGLRPEWLYVGVRDWGLSPRISLLDTPGYNSENPLHAECTVRALPHADLAVFVTEARGLSRSDLDFIQDYIAPQVSRLAVILNKVDIIDEPSEIDELLQVTHAKLKHFGFQHIDVLPCSATGVNDPYLGISGWDQVTAWLESLARDSLEELIRESIATDIAISFGPSCTAVEETRKLLTRNLEQLQNRLERLDQFSIRQAKQRCINDLKRQTKFEKSQVESAITLSINQQRTALFEWLDYGNVRDEDTVKEKFRELQSALQQALKHEISKLKTGASSARRNALQEINELIERDWRDLVQTQKEIYAHVTQGYDQTTALSEIPTIDLPDVDAEILGAAGGMGAGAMIGTMLLPGIGTIVGGLLGGLFGFLMGDADEKARDQIREAWFEYQQSFTSESTRVISTVYQDEASAHIQQLNRLEESYISQLQRYRVKLMQEQSSVDQRSRQVSAVKSILDLWLKEITGHDVDYVFARYRDADQLNLHHEALDDTKSEWSWQLLVFALFMVGVLGGAFYYAYSMV